MQGEPNKWGNLCFLIISFCLYLVFSSYISPEHFQEEQHFPEDSLRKSIRTSNLANLNKQFYRSIKERDTSRSRIILKQLSDLIVNKETDSLILSDILYHTGVYYYLEGKYVQSAGNFESSSIIREKKGLYDSIYFKTIYNLGVIANALGDFRKMELYALKYIEYEKKQHGESSQQLTDGYSSLVIAYLGLKEYDRAINIGLTALKLIEGKPEKNINSLATLYTNMGVCYIKLSNYSKAVLYLEKAEEIYLKYNIIKDDGYINLINTLAASYFFLGEYEKSDSYYTKGIKLADAYNSLLSQNFVISFAKVIGSAGKIAKGEEMMLTALRKAEKRYGANSSLYIYVLKNYADYISEFKKEPLKSMVLYEKCLDYIERNREDLSLKPQIMLGYALSLSENGYNEKALKIVQDLIYYGISGTNKAAEIDNPETGKIYPDQWSMALLKSKHKILWNLYKESADLRFLLSASSTSELLISILEKVRINIDEETSRIVLGDRSRDFYLSAIMDKELCFRKTGKREFIEKAFELSEKSKVAALLASTRELKATQFHIPSTVANYEKQLQNEISFYSARIADKSPVSVPDSLVISEWKNRIFSATLKRDSLIDMLEKEYPGYYMIKYNTRVIKPEEILKTAGRNINYISYLTGDTCLFIFISNRKLTEMVTVDIDSVFYRNLREFRKLLISPPFDDAATDYSNYQRLGSYLYSLIFKPVEKFLVSDRLLISPDNILSYLPFEAIPQFQVHSDRILYNKLPFMIKKFNISYAYSATFLAESVKSGFSLSGKLIAFAPVYSGSLHTDSIINTRQHVLDDLVELPYARQEAEFACRYIGGKLYSGVNALESVFKSQAGNYDIIHMAMHTVINDKDPMHSKMIFTQIADDPEDGLLNTYEVYGIPLRAKMVILSSCNTGTGVLHRGEGILSLARGFMYSGSESVVMSLWEIDDRSGIDILKGFYKFIRKGTNKSIALRKAKIKYLEKSDMLKSHPYFWSSFVEYGNDERLYFGRHIILLAGFIFILGMIISAIYYFKSR